ncbi:MAG: hypothetical protein V3U71_02130 [Cocleimonas sp.]
MFSKPVVFTILFAILLFIVLVLLGVKYHWTGFSFKSDSGVKTLSIPEEKLKSTINMPENSLKPVVEADVFTPEILNGNSKVNSLVESMTKQQIKNSCQELMRKVMVNDPTVDLAIINCVVSNFQEVFENNNNQEKSNEEQILELSKQEIDIKEQCIQENMYLEDFSLLQKQLLTGICISDLSSQ